MAYGIISYNILQKINGFPIAEPKAMLILVEIIGKKNSLYIDVFDRRDSTGSDKAVEMPSKNKDIKMPDVRHIPSKNKYTTSSRSREAIQSIQSRFELIEVNDGKKEKASEPLEKKNTMAYIVDIPIEQNHNCLPFKNTIKYTQVKFI